MKSIRYSFALFAALAACLFSGCANFSASIKAAVADPNKDAQAAQDAVALVANRVLKNNPSYAGDVTALGDAFSALAQENGSILTESDVQAILAKTSLSASDQAEIATDISTAQGTVLNDFDVTLPTLKPVYALFLQAVANGFYIATGHPSSPLPTITLPAATPAAPTAAAAPTVSWFKAERPLPQVAFLRYRAQPSVALIAYSF